MRNLIVYVIAGAMYLGTPASAQFASSNVALRAWLDCTVLACDNGNSCWGYVSPSGREYALMGCSNKLAFVEITNPSNPDYFASIPHTNSLWADVKVYGQYAYLVSEASGVGIQVIDLSQIDNHIVTLVRTLSTVGRSHTLTIDTTSGYLYTCGSRESPGTTTCWSLSNPANPVRVGPNSMTSTYIHEAMAYTYTSGKYAGRQIFFGGSEGRGVDIYDMTNKAVPVLIKRVTYPLVGYCHQMWLSADQKYLYVNDEFDENNNQFPTRTIVIDVSSLEDAHFETTFTSGINCVDHNLYVRDGFIYQSNYRSGLRIFDSNSDPLAPIHTGWFDTYPANNNRGYNGAWSNYPFFPSGIVIVSDIERGLFILDPSAAVTRNISPSSFTLVRGLLESGGLPEVAMSDNNYVTVKPGNSVSTIEPPVQVVFEATSHTITPKRLDVTIESSIIPPGVRQRLQVFNYTQNVWQTIDVRFPQATDTSFTVSLSGQLSDFVSSTDRKVRLFLVYEETDQLLSLSWLLKLDLVRWTIR